jgi:predicted acetyltransferase
MDLAGQLVSLSAVYKDALETFLREFDADPEELHGYFCQRDCSIEEAVRLLKAWGCGEEIQEGWVPCSTWFWESGGTLQGVINVRHRLTSGLREVGGHIGYSVARSHRRKGVATAMLKAVLPHCRALGIQRALLTCDSDNPASARTIEANGGVLEREGWLESAQRMQRWYWIDLN